MIAFHGIGAYRGQHNPLALRAMLSGVVGNAICAADRPIRAFGCVVSAPVAAVHPYDVWSERGERNAAIAQLDVGTYDGEIVSTLAEYRIYVRDQYGGSEAFIDPLGHKHDNRHHYCELWCEPTHIVALWVKDWADNRTKKAASIMAKYRALPLLTVKGTDRIWDCPTHDVYTTGTETPTMADIWPKQEIAA